MIGTWIVRILLCITAVLIYLMMYHYVRPVKKGDGGSLVSSLGPSDETRLHHLHRTHTIRILLRS